MNKNYNFLRKSYVIHKDVLHFIGAEAFECDCWKPNGLILKH